MIDSMLSLAFSIHSNKGVYALLLGSGISRTAGIPTGWEVVLDLIRKLASIQEEDCEPDPAAWYTAKFGEDPGYAKLLNQLAHSPAERNQLLKGYFEPDPEEREQGLKTPTKAHQAIAELVADGYVRVIVTTNFDRLLEKALEAVGVTPTVISTPDAVEGALPLAHTVCSIIKIHGDYLDTRIKNTPDELARYDKRVDKLLDRIFDEYGLIICGWSAEWDTALCGAIERCKSHRFTTYWAAKGEPGEKAQKLIQLRRAKLISIGDADTFFGELAEKVSALAEYAQPHPLSAKLAVASLKKYLVDDRYRIQLHDLVRQETEELYSELSDENFPVRDDIKFNNKEEFTTELNHRTRRYEALTETLQALLINGCYWGEQKHEYLWIKCLQRIANPSGGRNGWTVFLHLKLYPALLLMYAGGIASLAAEKYSTFSVLLTQAKARDMEGHFADQLLVLVLNPSVVIEQQDFARSLSGVSKSYTPLSEHLYQVLRGPFKEFLPQDTYYQKCFDRFEYLLALVHADLYQKHMKVNHAYGPVGCFGWRGRLRTSGPTIMSEIEAEITAEGQNWPLLKTGLFDGSIERFQSLKKAFDEFLKGLSWR